MKIIMKKKNGKFKYKKLRPKFKEFSRPTPLDLVYYEKSPSFCHHDTKMGSLGTKGRTCNISSSGADGCKTMCCDRGYYFNAEPVTKSCNCKFVWCCSVKCEKCTEIKSVYTCK